MVDGIVRERLLEVRSNFSRDETLKTPCGIDILSILNFKSRLNKGGIVPVKLLFLSIMRSSFDKEPSQNGKFPIKLLYPKLIFLILRKRDSSLGKEPVKLLELRSRVLRNDKLPICGAIVPPRL